MNCLYNRPIIFIINNIGLKMSDSIDPQKENRLMALINKVPFILQVVSGMVLGVIFAIILPNGQPVITMLGDLFVDALKAIAPFLVLALVMSSIALQKKGIDAKVKPIILLFVVSMLGATFVSLILTDIFPSTFAVLAVDILPLLKQGDSYRPI